jgi:hypothetical protein
MPSRRAGPGRPSRPRFGSAQARPESASGTMRTLGAADVRKAVCAPWGWMGLLAAPPASPGVPAGHGCATAGEQSISGMRTGAYAQTGCSTAQVCCAVAPTGQYCPGRPLPRVAGGVYATAAVIKHPKQASIGSNGSRFLTIDETAC